MTDTEANTQALITNTDWIIISTIVLVALFFLGKKMNSKKYVGRDDNSINIKNSDIKDSFNGKK
ncbi:hypothetical protein ACN2C1_07850 [Aliarcobacter butzleri]|uniref:hypothetical protein n=1 Tax=Aliarcobacter butzleri TaxID=28197 RepID=UPI003AFB128E